MIKLDMRGVACPKPVIETKKALIANPKTTVCTIVDNLLAVDNLNKLCADINANVQVNKLNEHLYYIYSALTSPIIINPVTLKNILVVNSNYMGANQELGNNLIQACFHILGDLDNIPKQIIFYNSGVLLFKSKQLFDDLKALEKLGVEFISCGTCITHFKIENYLGRISNMYEIMTALTSDEKIIYI